MYAKPIWLDCRRQKKSKNDKRNEQPANCQLHRLITVAFLNFLPVCFSTPHQSQTSKVEYFPLLLEYIQDPDVVKPIPPNHFMKEEEKSDTETTQRPLIILAREPPAHRLEDPTWRMSRWCRWLPPLFPPSSSPAGRDRPLPVGGAQLLHSASRFCPMVTWPQNCQANFYPGAVYLLLQVFNSGYF